MAVTRPPIFGLRPTSTSTFRVLVTLSPDPNLSLEGGFTHDRPPFSCDSGGNRTPEPFRAPSVVKFVSKDATEDTDRRCLSMVEFVESVRSRGLSCVSGESLAHLTCTVTLDFWLEILRMFCFSFSLTPRSVYSLRNAFVALLPD